MLFSQRHGFERTKQTLQLGSMDDDLRNGLWNALVQLCWPRVAPSNVFMAYEYTRCAYAQAVLIPLWRDFFKRPLDLMPSDWSAAYGELRTYFFGCPWNKAYDFVEFIAAHDNSPTMKAGFMGQCNAVLKQELSGYRFIGNVIAPITSGEQIASVEAAFARTMPLTPVHTHLETALRRLSDRKNPDYRNSVKESISAVESLCRLIAGTPKATLGAALERVEKTVPMHGALRVGFDKLYSYTNDADGIRHSLMEESTLDFEDAQFMLVSCSAFVSYLMQKCSKARIKLT
ncbi:MAG: hypothetical protein M1380_03080 [Chloroflexi bacterium]|nr:hypothetical protein [Chloroflexota bacterium]